MELFIIFRRAKQVAEQMGIAVAHAMVGEYLTVQEMGGFQMFVAKLDDELLALMNAPADAAYWTVR
jgi:dihydroxyacetone kinase-like protein